MPKNGQTSPYHVTSDITLYAIWLHKPQDGYDYDYISEWDADWNENIVVINLSSDSYITTISGSYEGGVEGMWTDRYFKFRVSVQNVNGSWETLFDGGKTNKFKKNYGKDRSGAGNFNGTLNGYYSKIVLDVYSSTRGPKSYHGAFKHGTDGDLYGKIWYNVTYGIEP